MAGMMAAGLEMGMREAADERDIEEEGLSAVSQISGIKSIDSPGIFVDDFTGFAFSDCSQRSFNCSMDLESGGMCPPFETIFVPVNTTVTTGLVKSSEGTHLNDPL